MASNIFNVLCFENGARWEVINQFSFGTIPCDLDRMGSIVTIGTMSSSCSSQYLISVVTRTHKGRTGSHK